LAGEDSERSEDSSNDGLVRMSVRKNLAAHSAVTTFAGVTFYFPERDFHGIASPGMRLFRQVDSLPDGTGTRCATTQDLHCRELVGNLGCQFTETGLFDRNDHYQKRFRYPDGGKRYARLQSLSSGKPIPPVGAGDMKRIWEVDFRSSWRRECDTRRFGLGCAPNCWPMQPGCGPRCAIFFRVALLIPLLESGLLDDWRDGEPPITLYSRRLGLSRFPRVFSVFVPTSSSRRCGKRGKAHSVSFLQGRHIGDDANGKPAPVARPPARTEISFHVPFFTRQARL
jgi:hypothetical protein